MTIFLFLFLLMQNCAQFAAYISSLLLFVVAKPHNLQSAQFVKQHSHCCHHKGEMEKPGCKRTKGNHNKGEIVQQLTNTQHPDTGQKTRNERWSVSEAVYQLVTGIMALFREVILLVRLTKMSQWLFWLPNEPLAWIIYCFSINFNINIHYILPKPNLPVCVQMCIGVCVSILSKGRLESPQCPLAVFV